MLKRDGIQWLLALFFSCCFLQPMAQSRSVDSLRGLLAATKKDTTKVNLLWNLASAYNSFDPDSARVIAEQALFLAQKIKYTEGESKSLGKLANAFNQIGNYPQALAFYLRQLELEEKRDDPENLASVTMNIGSVYVYQEEYDKALPYYSRADSIMKANPAIDSKFSQELKYSIALNTGDLYNRINKKDSALAYFTLARSIASGQQNGDFTGTAIVGIGEVLLKQRNFLTARDQFKMALPYLQEANDEDLVCETYWGLANTYDSLNSNDSARIYADQMLFLAKKDGFLRWQFNATQFLDQHYKKLGDMANAYAYMNLSQQLRDSISSKDKIRASQIISSNEQLRQTELAEQKERSKKERDQQLQFLLIAVFIPTLFLLTLLLNRRKIHIRVVRFMGIISLLILFEFLTLLLHPYVAELTGHRPIYELLIFVAIASIVIRVHHRLEKWFVNKLVHSKHRSGDNYFPIKRIRIKMKKPPGA